MDFSKTDIRFGREIASYTKVQKLVSTVIRGRSIFFKPFPSTPFLLDIGPGANLSKNFYNIDFDWRPGIDRCIDITKGIRLPQERVAGIFTEHCLEHIGLQASVKLLSELHAALVEGACIRIIVPDLELYARKYVQSIDRNINAMPYATSVRAEISAPAIPFNIVMQEHGHKFIFDFATMREILQRTGYRSIIKCAFGEGRDPRLLRDSPHRRIDSLYLEAQK